MSFVTDHKAIDYLKSFPKRSKADLKQVFPGSDDQALDFLSMLLSFNPFLRPSIQECLDHPYLISIKEYYKPMEEEDNQLNNHLEKNIQEQIFELEKEKEINFDKLRAIFLQEAQHFKNLRE